MLQHYFRTEYHCKVCNESFSGVKARKTHMKMHSAEEIGEPFTQMLLE